MAESEFEKIPSLLEKMKSTWGKINPSKSGNVKLDKSDLQTIREAFVAAANYKDLNTRWQRACRLFYHKDKPEFDYVKALREAAKIMEIVESTTKKGKKPKFHPKRNREIYEYYARFDAFHTKGEDGRYYDDEGNSFEIEDDYRKNLIIKLAKEFGFASPRAAAEYLRKTFGLKNLPDFRDHSKDSI